MLFSHIVLNWLQDTEILALDLIACNNYVNGLDAAKSINCPVLFVFGELDKMVNIEAGKNTFFEFLSKKVLYGILQIKDKGSFLL